LAHELAHIFCGHLGAWENGFWPDRHHVTHAVRECEAEAVAHFVTERLNLGIGSVRYLSPTTLPKTIVSRLTAWRSCWSLLRGSKR
jgi:hypothetical protein